MARFLFVCMLAAVLRAPASSFSQSTPGPCPDDPALTAMYADLVAYANQTPHPADFNQQIEAKARAIRDYSNGAMTSLSPPRAPNTLVTMCWSYSDANRALIKYFRLRRSQTQAGAYSELALFAPTTKSFPVKLDRTSHLCLTAVYDTKDAQGNITGTVETPCSNHVFVPIDQSLPPVP